MLLSTGLLFWVATTALSRLAVPLMAIEVMRLAEQRAGRRAHEELEGRAGGRHDDAIGQRRGGAAGLDHELRRLRRIGIDALAGRHARKRPIERGVGRDLRPGVEHQVRHRRVVERDDAAIATDVQLDLRAMDPDAAQALGERDVRSERTVDGGLVGELGEITRQLEQRRIVGEEAPRAVRHRAAQRRQIAEEAHRRAVLAPPHRRRAAAARDQRIPVRQQRGERLAVGVLRQRGRLARNLVGLHTAGER